VNGQTKPQSWISVQIRDIESGKLPNTIRLICFSNSHRHHRNIDIRDLDKCDIAICAGDFSDYDDYETVKDFGLFFGSLPSRYKVCLNGDHDKIE
jgi:hypothetical protein